MDEYSSGYISERTVLRWTARWVCGGAGAAHVLPDSGRTGAESQTLGSCRKTMTKHSVTAKSAPPTFEALRRRRPPPPPSAPPGPPLDVRLMRTAVDVQGD